jgi:uncharacterized protein (TIGR02145 family)
LDIQWKHLWVLVLLPIKKENMKGICLIFILSIIYQTLLFSQVAVKRNNQVSKEAANVNWSKEFTLFDYTTDEPIFPLIRIGQAVYKIYYASKEDPRPNYGEFSVTQVEGLKYYKFKNRETCLKFCLAYKLIAVPTLTTNTINTITTTSANSGGNITSDGGANITARGVVWATTSNPTISLTTKTFDGTGIGTFTSALKGLTPKTTYYFRAFATNSTGTGYGNEISFTTSDSSNVMGIPCPGTPTVKDIDGNIYNTVQIGTQCWTKENLKVSRYRNGDNIKTGLNDAIWGTTSSGAYTIYDNNNSNEIIYGKLYNWHAVRDKRCICPTGWNVPNEENFRTLLVYLGDILEVGGKMKKIGTAHWTVPNKGATNESGFSALPGGIRYDFGIYRDLGNQGYFWVAPKNDSEFDSGFALNTDNSSISFLGSWGNAGFSVRCIKDTTMTSIISPNITTTTVNTISTTTANCGGIIMSDEVGPIIARGVVWSKATNPTISLSTKTIDGIGTGTFISKLSNLLPNTTYYIRAYATKSVETVYGNELSFTTTNVSMGIPCTDIPTVKDIDGNIYNTVQIGTQCWMKDNLRVSKYRDGSLVPLDESGGAIGSEIGQTWSSIIVGARTVYGHDAKNFKIYGYLYNWDAAVDSKGICPLGWHVPADQEWTILTNNLGGEIGVGGKMKSQGLEYWTSPNTGASNESGFTTLPSGFRNHDGLFTSIGYGNFFWSTTEYNNTNAWYLGLSSANFYVYRYYRFKKIGASIRCLKDTISTVSLPSLNTTEVNFITSISTNAGGNITSDGGAHITERGVVWSTSTNPTIALTTKTSNGTGIGSFSSSLTNLAPKTIYYVRAYATNSAGTGYGNEISFTTSDSSNVMGIPCPGTPTVKDIDGNTYNTVQIGTQCWTKENLKVTKYKDGTNIPLDESGGAGGFGSGHTWDRITGGGARTIYGHIASNLVTYGYLYNWFAASDTKGICPSGWHVPSDEEWTNLTTQLGGKSVAGGKLKSTGTTLWDSPNTEATNESGFSALPGGKRDRDGTFNSIGGFAWFWPSLGGNDAWLRGLTAYKSNVDRSAGYLSNKAVGASIRCLKD